MRAWNAETIWRSNLTKKDLDMEKAHIFDFLVGMSMGAATALLFAPCSGKRTRARITEVATNGVAHVKDSGETLSDAVSGLIDEVAQHKEGVAEAIQRGIHAYKQAIS
jgi:gas vesicle protein